MESTEAPCTLQVDGMTCANCAMGIQKLLQNKGLDDVNVNFAAGEVRFSVKENYTIEAIKKDIENLGYQVIEPENPTPIGLSFAEKRFIFSLVFTLPLLAHMVISWHPLHNAWVQLALCLPVMISGIMHFGKSAYNSLKTGVPNMDVLITIGASSAFVYSIWGSLIAHTIENPENYLFFETAASIFTLVLMGNIIEQRSVKKTGDALRELSALQPETAKRISLHENHEHIEEIPARLIIAGDILLIQTGDRIPADGILIEGSGLLNEALISGESMPLEKSVGNELTGGTINENGIFKMRALKTGRETVLAGIIELVKKAQSVKPPAQRLGDKVSAVFVPVVIAISLITFFASLFVLNITLQESLLRAIAVLVISCPCAMGLATPTAVMVGIGRAAKLGILFRDGAAIEHLAKIKTLVFDKTGTLTTGNFRIEKLDVFHEHDISSVYSLIRSIEQHSTHPIAKSIVSSLDAPFVQLVNIQESKGLGMIAETTEGKKIEFGSSRLVKEHDLIEKYDLFLIENGQCIAALSLSDELKQGAKAAVQSIQKMGIKTILLSGDSERKCKLIADEIGITEIYFQQSPEGKLKIIEQLNTQQATAMFGDGVNDAPALNMASVGISLGDASKVAWSSAQVILLQKRTIEGLPLALKLSKMTLRTIYQNLFWAFFYNTIAIPIAAVGLLQPMIAAFSMAFSDVIVIGNSIRLKYRI